MALLGSDFIVTSPDDTDPVSQGAAAIRDIKARLKAFVSVYFDPETGLLARTQTTITVSSTRPTNPQIGDIYWDTTLGKAFIYLATGWTELCSCTSGGGSSSTSFTSAPFTLVSMSQVTLAHGLSAVPAHVQMWLVCQSADIGYSPGDKILFMNDFSLGRSANAGADSTNVVVYMGDGVGTFMININKTAGQQTADSTKWKMFVTASL